MTPNDESKKNTQLTIVSSKQRKYRKKQKKKIKYSSSFSVSFLRLNSFFLEGASKEQVDFSQQRQQQQQNTEELTINTGQTHDYIQTHDSLLNPKKIFFFFPYAHGTTTTTTMWVSEREKSSQNMYAQSSSQMIRKQGKCRMKIDGEFILHFYTQFSKCKAWRVLL